MTADLILGIDTTSRHGSASLATAAGIEKTIEWRASPSHTVNLQRAGAALLEHAGDRLVAVAVAAGPGGFSSVRTGMAYAKGICLALDIKLSAVESLTALAASLPLMEPRRVVAALDAGRSSLFAREFEVGGALVNPLGDAALLSAIDLVALTTGDALLAGAFDEARRLELEAFTGDGASLQFISPVHPLAEAVAVAGWAKIGEMSGREVRTAVPTYLRAPGATLPKRGWGKA
jgi:tRNA threonylcarbamoyladenosine biosynthesis protein TsaB